MYNPEMRSKVANKEKSIRLYKEAIKIANDEYDREVAEERLNELVPF
ncbi:hypothetical protein ACI2OX_21415 [Bacillus sp. N9]